MSNGLEFFQTRMGHKFYESDVPRIAKALEDIVLRLGNPGEPKTAAVAAIAKAGMEVTSSEATVRLTYRKGSGADTFTEVAQESLQAYLDEGWELVEAVERVPTPEEAPGFLEWAKAYAAQYGSLDAIEAYKAGAASMTLDAGPKHPNPMHPDNDASDGTDALCQAVYRRNPCARDYLGGSEARMLYDAATLIEAYRSDVADAAGEVMVDIPEPGSDTAKLLAANRLLMARVEELENSGVRLTRRQQVVLGHLVDTELIRRKEEGEPGGQGTNAGELEAIGEVVRAER